MRAIQDLSFEPDVVRLPAEVLEAAYFEVSGSGRIIFDLTQTHFLATPAVTGLLRTAKVTPVQLVLPPGPVLDKLCQLFGYCLRRVAACDWEICL